MCSQGQEWTIALTNKVALFHKCWIVWYSFKCTHGTFHMYIIMCYISIQIHITFIGLKNPPCWTHERIFQPQCKWKSQTPPSVSDGWTFAEVVGLPLYAHLSRWFLSTSQSAPWGPVSTASVTMVSTAARMCWFVLCWFFSALMCYWELGQLVTVWMHSNVSCFNL